MVVVRPLRKVVRKFDARKISACVLKIDDDELLVLVGGLEQRRFFIVRSNSKDVAVLCLLRAL